MRFSSEQRGEENVAKMKDNFELTLLASGDIMKKGYAFLINNIGKAIALITITVTALVLFTDIGFADFGSEKFTSTLAVMITASYIMYFSLEDAGEKLGEESEEYKKAMKNYIAATEKIDGSNLMDLRQFCEGYSSAERDYRRKMFLMRSGYGTDEYENYKSGGFTPDKKTLRVFRKADKMQPTAISPKTLLAKERSRDDSELRNPEKAKFFRMLPNLIPCMLSMSVTVSVMLTAKENMNLATVADGILKLSGLPIIGFKGYSAGYNYVKNSLCLWIETKTRLIEAFISKIR